MQSFEPIVPSFVRRFLDPRWITHLPSAVREFRNWPTYIRLLRSRGPGKAVLETRDGVKIQVRENIWDARIVREIFIDKPYLQGLALPSTPTVIDIGSYIGDFTLYAAVRLGARVIAYEPTAENYAMLTSNVRLNGLSDRVTTINEAVGRSGTLKLNVEIDGQEVHSSGKWYEGAPAREVPSVTLDDVLAANGLGRIDLLKVDCEGGEFDIFEHASHEALTRVDRIALEWHELGPETEALKRKMRDRIERAGLHVTEHRRQIWTASR